MVLAVPNSGAALAADELSEHNGVAEWEAGQERAIEAVYLLPINLLIVRVVVVEYDLQPCACTSSRVAAPLSCLVRTAVEHDRDIHQATHRGGIDNEVLFVFARVVVASYNTESCDVLLGLGCLFLVCVCHGFPPPIPSEYPDTVGGQGAWPNLAILRPGERVGVAHRVRPCLVCDSRVARTHLPESILTEPDVPTPVISVDDRFPHGSLLLYCLYCLATSLLWRVAPGTAVQIPSHLLSDRGIVYYLPTLCQLY